VFQKYDEKVGSGKGGSCLSRWLGWDTYSSDNLIFKTRWANRTFYTDWFVDWLSPFVEHSYKTGGVKEEYLHFISEEEKAHVLYDRWVEHFKAKGGSIKSLVWKLVFNGMCKYGI
jgi:hypothetical protein